MPRSITSTTSGAATRRASTSCSPTAPSATSANRSTRRPGRPSALAPATSQSASPNDSRGFSARSPYIDHDRPTLRAEVRTALPKIIAVPEADLKLLRQFDTPTICNVVELFDLRSRTAGYTDKRIQACYPKLPPMVGYASTATFRSAAPPTAGNVYSGLAEQVAS